MQYMTFNGQALHRARLIPLLQQASQYRRLVLEFRLRSPYRPAWQESYLVHRAAGPNPVAERAGTSGRAGRSSGTGIYVRGDARW